MRGRAHGGNIERIKLTLSVNVYKNGRSVMLPHTGGLKGNRLAAALGALAGNPERGLTVLQDMTPETVTRARALVDSGAVEEHVAQDVPAVWIQVEVEGEGIRPCAAYRGDTIVWNAWRRTERFFLKPHLLKKKRLATPPKCMRSSRP